MAQYSTEQQAYIKAMRGDILKTRMLSGTDCYVVAGFGGDTYYCYVGEGKGYQGSPFFPATTRAICFGNEYEAKKHCYTGYRNGNGKGDLLDLHPVKASEFFTKIADDQQKQLDWAIDMWNKNVGKQ